MAVSSGQVATNSSTATQIVAAANTNTIYIGKGQSPRNVVLYNVDATNDVYIGPAGVTSGTGFKLLHGSQVNLVLEAGDAVYGISSASTPTVHYIESGT